MSEEPRYHIELRYQEGDILKLEVHSGLGVDREPAQVLGLHRHWKGMRRTGAWRAAASHWSARSDG